jgi:hypothetical protein
LIKWIQEIMASAKKLKDLASLNEDGWHALITERRAGTPPGIEGARRRFDHKKEKPQVGTRAIEIWQPDTAARALLPEPAETRRQARRKVESKTAAALNKLLTDLGNKRARASAKSRVVLGSMRDARRNPFSDGFVEMFAGGCQ